jgi:hypothetical protein
MDNADAGEGSPLIIFENPDKLRSRASGDDPSLPRWPFSLLAAGPPNVGKRNLLLNIIFRLRPPPSAVHLVHCDPETREYDLLQDLGVPLFFYSPDDFPTADNLEHPEPVPVGDSEVEPVDIGLPEPEVGGFGPDAGTDPLVIVDEITEKGLNGASAHRFERLLNFASTHKNTTVLCSIQAVNNLPPKVRRGFSQFVLWPQRDRMATALAATRAGVPPELLEDLFGLCRTPYESIWIDATQPAGSPWRFRLNMTKPIRSVETVCAEDYPAAPAEALR